MTGSLIWLRRYGTWSPQKWPDDSPARDPVTKAPEFVEHKLTAEEYALPFDELVRRYPAPASVADAKVKIEKGEAA